MSTSIDDKIVSLKFDNSDFAQKAEKTIGSIEKLNKVLDFSNHIRGGKGLESLSQAIKGNDLSGMEKSVSTIAERFSNLGIIGVTALQNITNKAVDAGTRLVKSLTIDPIKSGLNEYELKMGSMRTILASTRNEFNSEAEAVKSINERLNELNKYSDETIYSFSDMTNNIGKFTNAGVKLDVAVQAIKGISNEAAISGANANEASRAMYNFSQALSAGYVKLIDWKSIENANMATKEFKEQLIETAVATGTLTKKGNVYLTSKGKEITATKNFNDSLQDQWMTTEVLTTTLNNYATDVTRMTKSERTAYEEKLKSIGYTDKQIKKIEETGTKAYQAAAEITTWSKLVDTLQEAVQSGWAQTFEILFGNIKEATKLWTGFGNAISSIIGKMSDARNNYLQAWKDAGGRKALLDGIANVLKYIGSLLKPIGEAFREVFPPASGKALAEATIRFNNFSKSLHANKETIANIKDTFKGLFSVVGLAKTAFTQLASAIIPAGSAASSFAEIVSSVTGYLGRLLSSLTELIKQSGIIETTASRVRDIVQMLIGLLKDLGDGIQSFLAPINRKSNNSIDDFAKSMKGVSDSADAVKSKTKTFENLREAMAGLGDSPTTKKLSKFRTEFESAFGITDTDSLAKGLLGILKIIGIVWLVKKGWDKLSSLGNAFGKAKGVFSSMTEGTKSLKQTLVDTSFTMKSISRNVQMQTFSTMAKSISLLATAVTVLSKIPKNDLKKALISIGIISGVLVALVKLTMSSEFSAKTVSAFGALASAFISVGVAMNLIAAAAKILASIKPADLIKAGVAMGAFMLAISVLTKHAKGSLRGAITFAIVATSVGVGLTMLLPSIILLSNISVGDLVKTGLAISSFIILLSKTASYIGKDKIKIGQFILLSAAVAILAPAISTLSSIPFLGAVKAAVGIGLVISSIALSSKLIGKDRVAFVSFAMVAFAVSSIAPAILALSSLPISKAVQSAALLTVLMASLAGTMRIIGGGDMKNAFSKSVVLVAMSLAIVSASKSLIILAAIPFGSLLKSIAALNAVMISLMLTSRIAVGSKKNMIIMALIFSILAKSVSLLGSVNPTKAIVNMAGLAAMLSSVAVACSLMAAVPFTAAITALAKFAIFLAGMTAIITALGAIASKFDGFVKYLKKGAKLGAYIGEFIGGLVGGILGGVIGGVSAGLITLGKNLSAFMDSLKPFLDGVKSVTPETATCVKNLATAILYLTAADLLNQLNSTPLNILSGGGMVSFAKDLGLFIDALKPIGEKAKDVPNIESINKISKTIAALAKATTEIPSIGGVRGLIMGVKDLGEFGKQLGTFVDTLSSMQENDFKMGKTDLHSISNIARAVKTLGEAANEMPETTVSLKGIVFGMKDIGKFAEQLASFAPKFSEFMSNITSDESNISNGGLDKVIHMGRAVAALAKAANEIPQELDSESLMAKIDGVKDLPKFADGITAIGNKIPPLIEASAGMDKGAAPRIIRMANVIKAMATAANEIHEISGGGKRTIGADFDKQMDELGQFTDGLSSYAESFKGFAETAKGIGAKQLEAATSVSKSIKTMSEAAVAVSGIKGKADGIKEKLDSLASGLESYANKVNGLDVGNLSANTDALKDSIKATTKALSGGKKNAKSSASSAISSYVKGLKSGASTKGASDAAASVRKAALDALNKTSGFTKAGNAAVSKYVGAIGKAKGAKGAGKDLAGKAKDAAKGVSFTGAGKDAALGFAEGLGDSDAIAAVSSAGSYIGEVALKAAEKKIKRGSPAKEFIAIGRDGTRGFAIGLKNYASLVYEAGQKVGAAGIKGTRDSISDLDLMLTDPHITPVLDLSNVQKGADQINSMLGDSANIDANLMNASVYRQNGGKMDEIVDRLGKVLNDNIPSDNSPKEMYSIGDVTVDVSKLEDVTTLNQFVDILKMAKSIA